MMRDQRIQEAKESSSNGSAAKSTSQATLNSRDRSAEPIGKASLTDFSNYSEGLI